MRDIESNNEDDLTATERVWIDFLRAHSPANAAQPTVRFVRLMIGICERRAR